MQNLYLLHHTLKPHLTFRLLFPRLVVQLIGDFVFLITSDLKAPTIIAVIYPIYLSTYFLTGPNFQGSRKRTWSANAALFPLIAR